MNKFNSSISFLQLHTEYSKQIQELAKNYRFPHNILGTHKATDYVNSLFELSRLSSKEGWFGLVKSDIVICAANIRIYGNGDGNHKLWKIRHILSIDYENYLISEFLNCAFQYINSVKTKSAKMVLFLGEHEKEYIKSAEDSEMIKEACFHDYYRLGEKCFVYSITIL